MPQKAPLKLIFSKIFWRNFWWASGSVNN